MLHLSILILQSTIQYTTAVTPHVTFYWKTTEEMDKVPDYWNHGPINIPGLEDIFTQTTKPPDVFPPWLTKRTKTAVTALSTAITKHSSPNSHELIDENINSTLVHLLKTLTQPKIDKNTTEMNSLWQAIQQRLRMNLMSKSTQHGTTTKLIMSKPTQHATTTKSNMPSRDYEDIQATDPFSVFLSKIAKSLTTKSLPEVPALIKAVVVYMEKLLKDNALERMSFMVPYIEKVVKNIRTFLSSTSPGMLHTKCYELSAMLSNQSALETDYTNLLTALDDMYTEAEEEHMQRILRNVIEFPNTDITAQAIAHDFVDNLILFPMKRVLGTSKGADVLLMLKSVIEKKDLRRNWNLEWNNRAITSYEDNEETNSENDVQHSIYKFRAHEKYTKEKNVNATKGYTEGIYQTVRNNIHHIKSLMKNIEVSSSETNEYELSSLESEGIIKKSTDNINTPSLPNTQSFRSGQLKALRKGFSLERLYGEYKEDSPSSEILQYEFSSSLESKERVKEAADDINTFYFRRKKDEMVQQGNHEESYKNNKSILRHNKYEVNSDKLNSLFNKYDVMPRVPNDKYRRDQIDIYKNTKPTIIVPGRSLGTEIIKDSVMYGNSPLHKLISSGNVSIKAITRSIREPRYNVFYKKPPIITYSSRHPFTILYLTNNNTRLERKPNDAIISKYMIQMSSYQNSNEGTTDSFIHNKIEPQRIHHGYMNKTKHNNVIGEYLNTAHQKELENSILNTEYSSEDTGDRLQNKHARVEKSLSSPLEVLEHPQGRSKNKKHPKRSRSNRHTNKHEKRKHNEHGHNHSHNEKRKYEKLKRKYQKLKQRIILVGQNIINNDNDMMFDKKKKLEKRIKINYHKSLPSLVGDMKQKAININVRNKQHAKGNTNLFTAKMQRPEVNLWLRRQRQEKSAVQNYIPTTKVMKYLKEKKINMCSYDYDYDSKLETPQFKKTNNRPYYAKTSKAYTFNGGRINRKSFPNNATTGKVFKSSEDTDEEKELKKNIYDAFRHMEFNVSRSYHNDTTSKAYLQVSQETDVEAVLKSNIYKAVKKLLNK